MHSATLGKSRNAAAMRSAACRAGTLLVMAVALPFLLPASFALTGVQRSVVGISAEDFSLQDMDRNQVKLSDFRGRTVLLSFWATWCLPCKAEMPTIQKIYEEHKDKDVVVLTVDDENEATIRKFMDDHHYSFRALLDHKRTLYQKFAIRFIPTVFIIDDEGTIVREIVGWHGPQALLSALKAGEHENPRSHPKVEDQGTNVGPITMLKQERTGEYQEHQRQS